VAVAEEELEQFGQSALALRKLQRAELTLREPAKREWTWRT
jgi:hypothetical protein